MIEENQREWPSFGDILDELNTLGVPEGSPLPQPSEPAPSEDGTETGEDLGSIESAPLDPSHEVADVSELHAEPNWAPLDESLGAESTATAAVPDGAEALVSEEIDWSSWDFDPATGALNDALATDFAPESPMSTVESDRSAEIVEFDLATVDSTDSTDSTDDTDSSDSDIEPIDSVATADAIETDLHELFGFVEVDESESDDDLDSLSEDPASAADLAAALDAESPSTPEHEDTESHDTHQTDHAEQADGSEEADPDNVVRLHRKNDLAHQLVGLDDVFDPAKPQSVDTSTAAEFVSIDDDESDSDDSWDYLRPAESADQKSGVFSRRPKFFGGDERRSRKAERKSSEEKTEIVGPPCPKCDATGRVDLNDPIGGKVHCSCLECDHVWSQFAKPAQESA